jgi:hypothetical protein
MNRTRTILTVLLGAVLIAVLTPLAQFLTIGLINSDMETATPVGWAVGLVVSLALVVAAVRWIARRQVVSKSHLVLLYCMLTIAAPMMNIGMVRALFLSIRVVQEHYVNFNNNTYRTAYQAQSPDWFPVVPTTEGLAWNKSLRILRQLEDSRAIKQREDARREATLAISLNAKRLARSAGSETAAPDSAGVAVREKILQLGVDEVETILKQAVAPSGQTNLFRESIVALGLMPDLERQLESSRRKSAEAAERLAQRLATIDEQDVAYLPAVLSKRSRKERNRFDRDLARLTPDERAGLDARVKQIAASYASLSADVSVLSRIDFVKVRNRRRDQYLAAFASLSQKQLAAIRASFIYRSSGAERKEMYGQDGRNGTPNQNLQGFQSTLWADQESQRALQGAGMWQKVGAVLRGIPWTVWRAPLLHWTALIGCIFLFLMCLSEWLRRKWVDRENLAFPLVEVVDSVIRHDYELETAADVTAPERRRFLFNGVFWAGFAVGALILTVEALANYGFRSDVSFITFPVSERFFTSGIFRNISNVFFVLSPIVVGILFLVSLEISFSIWVTYFIYQFVVAVCKQSGDFRDSIYTGYGGGMMFPFQTEQLLGACLCLAMVALWKTWRTRVPAADASVLPVASSYIPKRLNTAGLALLPLAIGLLLWNLGVHNIPLLVFVCVIAICIAVAVARVRAETGLPANHVTYEFAKIPIVFGLTGAIGARVYTLFVSIAFLPITLLFRLLPQQLENIELARRNRIRYGTVAAASLVAFAVAIGVGILSFLVLCYYKGETVWAGFTFASSFGYPYWVSHFLGENGLENFRQVHWIRVWLILVGAGVFGGLMLLRSRIARFPIHPLGYVLVLMTFFFKFVVPYNKMPSGTSTIEASWLWGSALVAWMLKKLIVKYGGMNTYRKAKPIFIGLVVGAVFAIFLWNIVDLGASIWSENLKSGVEPADFLKPFVNHPAFSPKAY